MIFAAGRGTRMGHLTQKKPKSLLEIAGKPILHYSLELALTYSFKKIIINTHYFAEQVVASVKEFVELIPKTVTVPEIVIIHEPILLETGGAIKNAINILGDKPIFTLASDVIISSKTNLFEHVLSAWKPDHMDFLLMLQETENSIGYVGQGDFDLDIDGRLVRQDTVASAVSFASKPYKYMYTSLQILKPGLIAQNPSKIFPVRDYYFNNQAAYGVKSPQGCRWYHANSPEDIRLLRKVYS